VHGLIAKTAAFWQVVRFAAAASALTHTLLGLAGVLLGKTSLDWLYGLRGGLPQNCATVLAIPIRPGSGACGRAE
jgi:hypothetical protein